MICTFGRFLLIGAVCALCVSNSYGDLYEVTFNDADGPMWKGIVDTQADNLTITEWNENPGGDDFWTPTLLPMTPWIATAPDGSAYDVPDNFDGTISDFGFISPLSLGDIDWNEGPSSVTTRPGWGAFLLGGSIYIQRNETFTDQLHVAASGFTAAVGSVSIQSIPEPVGGTLVLAFGLLGLRRRRSKLKSI